MISDLWEKYHRKEFIKSIDAKISLWSDVVIIQSPVSILVHIINNIKRIFLLLKGHFKLKKINSNTLLFTPVIPFHYRLWNKYNIFFKIDYYLLRYELNKFINKNFGKRNTILWVYSPELKKLAEKFKCNFTVYDQYDLYNYDLNGNENKKITDINNKLLQYCDLVFCTTKFIYDFSIKININSFYITNGNNYEFLTKNNHEISLNKLTEKQIVGYVGGIRNWLDFELLNYIIDKINYVNFVFIGKIYGGSYTDLENILKKKNVFWYDYIPQEKLGSYMKSFSVGLIPFKMNSFFKGVFPNKFYEYMALEIPIVSTFLPELSKYEKIIGLSKSNEEFKENVISALNGDFDKFKPIYTQEAKLNTWEKKAAEWNKIIKNHIQKET